MLKDPRSCECKGRTIKRRCPRNNSDSACELASLNPPDPSEGAMRTALLLLEASWLFEMTRITKVVVHERCLSHRDTSISRKLAEYLKFSMQTAMIFVGK